MICRRYTIFFWFCLLCIADPANHRRTADTPHPLGLVVQTLKRKGEPEAPPPPPLPPLTTQRPRRSRSDSAAASLSAE